MINRHLATLLHRDRRRGGMRLLSCACAVAIAMGPTFDVLVVNVTVVVGQTALLPCSIQHLGRHKVHYLIISQLLIRMPWTAHHSLPKVHQRLAQLKILIQAYCASLL